MHYYVHGVLHSTEDLNVLSKHKSGLVFYSYAVDATYEGKEIKNSPVKIKKIEIYFFSVVLYYTCNKTFRNVFVLNRFSSTHTDKLHPKSSLLEIFGRKPLNEQLEALFNNFCKSSQILIIKSDSNFIIKVYVY